MKVVPQPPEPPEPPPKTAEVAPPPPVTTKAPVIVRHALFIYVFIVLVSSLIVYLKCFVKFIQTTGISHVGHLKLKILDI